MSHTTPGPWSVLTLDDGTEWVQSGCVRVAIVDDSAGCEPGNAALIAAAPEMLEALEALVDMVDSGDYRQATLNAADAAIRKARGEE